MKNMRKNPTGHYICDKEDCGVLTPILYRNEKEWICDECWVKELSKGIRLKAQKLLKDGKKRKKHFRN